MEEPFDSGICGLAIYVTPTSAVVVDGLAIVGVEYVIWLHFVWLVLLLFALTVAMLNISVLIL